MKRQPPEGEEGHNDAPRLRLIEGGTAFPRDAEERRQRRNLLVQAATGLVHQRASYYASRFRGYADRSELVSVGTFALLRAADRFVPSRNNTWTTYARYWVNGAMLREVKGNVHRVRCERAMMLAACHLQAAYREEHDPWEQSDSAQIAKLVTFFESILVASLTAGYDEAARSPETELEEAESASELRDAFAATLRGMMRRDRQVIWLVYHEGYDINEAASRLGITRATVYRRHDRAVAVLRSAVKRLDILRPPRVPRWPLLDFDPERDRA